VCEQRTAKRGGEGEGQRHASPPPPSLGRDGSAREGQPTKWLGIALRVLFFFAQKKSFVLFFSFP